MTKTPAPEQIYKEQLESVYKRTDRMFAILFVIQFFGGILAAIFISPLTWEGNKSSIHIHVWTAIIFGFIIASLPVTLAYVMPGKAITRHVIAVAQMLFSALLIHLTGGRAETHFHVFGSLAFLGFYRDWKVLISASMVVSIDHFARGLWWPESVYGTVTSSSLRWIEHTAWVLFEDLFIILATKQSTKEMWEIAKHRAFTENIAEERKTHVEQLQTTEAKLKEALDIQETFISICGHELKTPLVSLKLQAQIVNKSLEKLEGKTSADENKVKRFASQISSQVDKLNRVVDDLLDVAKIKKEKLTIHKEEVNLGELVKDVTERCQPQASLNSCEIQVNAHEDVVGFWDKFRIEQVLVNIIVNSCKYGSGKPVEISVFSKNNEAVISISDQGIGIDPKDQHKVFNRFERISADRKISGLGLGLYISKNIVEQHGGKIELKSDIGQGTTFKVRLPVEEQALIASV